jgi:hypothetical protein
LVATDLRKASTHSRSAQDRVSLTPTAGTKSFADCVLPPGINRSARPGRCPPRRPRRPRPLYRRSGFGAVGRVFPPYGTAGEETLRFLSALLNVNSCDTQGSAARPGDCRAAASCCAGDPISPSLILEQLHAWPAVRPRTCLLRGHMDGSHGLHMSQPRGCSTKQTLLSMRCCDPGRGQTPVDFVMPSVQPVSRARPPTTPQRVSYWA